MSGDSDARAVRVRHFQGERLRGADLQDEYDNITSLRGLHVVALHDTWGIALGFEVRAGPQNTYVVGPGLAYDCLGREIVLAHEHGVPGPQLMFPATEVEGGWELVMRYDPDLGRREAVRDTTPCPDAGAGCDMPAFAWRRPSDVRLGLEVPLAAVVIENRTAGALLTQVRRYTQPLARPHVAAGLTGKEQRWLPWSSAQSLEAVGQVLGVQTFVDTRAAGFVGTPYYLASLDMAPEIMAGITRTGLVLTHVAGPSAAGFIFRIVLVRGGDSGPVIERLFAAAQEPQQPIIRVSWTGVEPAGGCTPEADVAGFIRRFILRRTFIGGFLRLGLVSRLF